MFLESHDTLDVESVRLVASLRIASMAGLLFTMRSRTCGSWVSPRSGVSDFDIEDWPAIKSQSGTRRLRDGGFSYFSTQDRLHTRGEEGGVAEIVYVFVHETVGTEIEHMRVHFINLHAQASSLSFLALSFSALRAPVIHVMVLGVTKPYPSCARHAHPPVRVRVSVCSGKANVKDFVYSFMKEDRKSKPHKDIVFRIIKVVGLLVPSYPDDNNIKGLQATGNGF